MHILRPVHPEALDADGRLLQRVYMYVHLDAHSVMYFLCALMFRCRTCLITTSAMHFGGDVKPASDDVHPDYVMGRSSEVHTRCVACKLHNLTYFICASYQHLRGLCYWQAWCTWNCSNYLFLQTQHQHEHSWHISSYWQDTLRTKVHELLRRYSYQKHTRYFYF